jgi:NRAMP (natural resistance-associated macrophage protein)-like metal ion transporter
LWLISEVIVVIAHFPIQI